MAEKNNLTELVGDRSKGRFLLAESRKPVKGIKQVCLAPYLVQFEGAYPNGEFDDIATSNRREAIENSCPNDDANAFIVGTSYRINNSIGASIESRRDMWISPVIYYHINEN